MSNIEEMRRRIKEASRKSREAADAELDAQLEIVINDNTHDLESLRPQLQGQEGLEELIVAVNQATAQNEAVASLRERIKDLGSKVVEAAKKAAEIL